ncbi:MAG: HAMP domain-containing histidine kinase [Alphaproteobacteria bacterium]|nr:HAMP domain-containing histidine kinase [Alphaproteobacteria bacterium]
MPRTLAARTVVLLLVGLLLAQLLGTAIDTLDRGKAFYRSTTLQMAERIADLAKALDAVRPPDQRAEIARRLSDHGLVITLSRGPQHIDGASERSYARTFHAMVSRDLGPGWPINVQLHRVTVPPNSSPAFAADAPAGFLDHYLTLRQFYPMPRGFAFVTRVQLSDGSLVTFSAPLPYETVTRFYVLLPKLALMLTIVIALLLVAVRWVTRPMKRMAQAALALGQDLNRVPIAESGPEEIRTTARALNVMQLRLQEYVRDRAAILAALSHDLKTYITRVRLRGELLPESHHRDRLIADVGEMTAMIDSTLEYLHGLSPARGRAQFDAMALAESVRIDAEDMGWPVAVAGTTSQPFYGNVQDLRRCLMNLVDNAVKYGGRATIQLEDGADELTIRVCDPGPGIPAGERERVFEPFYRSGCADTRDLGGTGLGLSIARTIARAHGGDVVLQNNTPLGFCAAIRLPRANA